MQQKALTSKKRLILGLGTTGLSVARYLDSLGQEYKLMDTRKNPPMAKELAELSADALIEWNGQTMLDFDELVVNPGIATSHPDIQAAKQQGISIVGDIELFAQVNTKPVIAITGSNGKSTVTELAATLINASGKKAAIGGNFGIPALELLNSDADYMVLELSSFQLETTDLLAATCATILNISEDHLDRYESYQAYIAAKHRIYKNAQNILINKDDSQTIPTKELLKSEQVVTSFGLNADWSLDNANGYISRKGKAVIELSSLKLQGQHNGLNLASALALIELAGIEINEGVLTAAREYQGLEHRCQLVGEFNKVTYINDSKATNVGATLAAVQSFSGQFEDIILLTGGDAKGADLSPLKAVLSEQVKAQICFGQDAEQLEKLAPTNSSRVTGLAQAVTKSIQIAEQGDLVLLSPACASTDMFSNYIERGNQFMQLVRSHYAH